MKKLIVLFSILTILIQDCSGQKQFDRFVKRFPLLSSPIDSVQSINYRDTVDTRLFNYIVWESQPRVEKDGKIRIGYPKIIKNGKSIDLTNYGKVSETPLVYETMDGHKGKFFSKVYPIGRINLQPNFISLIVKTHNSELSYFDLYNFSKDGKRLSVVPLFTYVHKKMLVDKVDHVITKSSIQKNGDILWFENNRGLTTNRIYRLRNDGYFEIIKEEQTGQFEY